MKKITNLLKKIPRILVTGLLLWFVIFSTISSSNLFAQDSTKSDISGNYFQDAGKLVNLYFGGEDAVNMPSAAILQSVNISSLINVLNVYTLGVYGVANSSEEAAQLIEKYPYAQRLNYGLAGTVENMNDMAFLYLPNFMNTKTYMANEFKYKSVSSSNAAGPYGYGATYGTDTLIPVYRVWYTFKNIALALYVVLVIVIGFMIMLRSKINGQVSVSIVNAIPRVILGVVLVQLSYLLVALIIDTALVGMGIVAQLMKEILSSEGMDAASLDRYFINLGGPFNMAGKISLLARTGVVIEDFSLGSVVVNGLILMAVGAALGSLSGLGPGTAIGALVGLGIGIVFAIGDAADQDDSIRSSVINAITTAGGSISNSNVSKWKLFAEMLPDFDFGTSIIRLIMAVGFIYGGFKIFFLLIKSYAMVFVKVVLMPFSILIGSLPGQGKIIMTSFISVGIDMLVFPVVLFLLNFAILIAWKTSTSTPYGLPIPFPTVEIFSGKVSMVTPGAGNIGGVIAYVIYLVAGSADVIIKEAFKYQDPRSAQVISQSIAKISGKAPVWGKMAGGLAE